MENDKIQALLQQVSEHKISVEDALLQIKNNPLKIWGSPNRIITGQSVRGLPR